MPSIYKMCSLNSDKNSDFRELSFSSQLTFIPATDLKHENDQFNDLFTRFKNKFLINYCFFGVKHTNSFYG